MSLGGIERLWRSILYGSMYHLLRLTWFPCILHLSLVAQLLAISKHIKLTGFAHRQLEEQYGTVLRAFEIRHMERDGLVRSQLSRHEHRY